MRPISRLPSAFLWLTLCLHVPALASQYVVAPHGSDANPGSEAAPFKTIGKAAEVMIPGDVCLVRAGVYRETVTPAHDGEAGKPIVFAAWRGERPVVTGLDEVSGWRRTGKGRWRTHVELPLGSGNQVFFGDVMGDEVRWPNNRDADPMTPDAARIASGDAGHIVCNEFPNGLAADAFDGTTLWVIAGAKWSSWTMPVTGYDPAVKTIRCEPHRSKWITVHMNPKRRGGIFVVTGGRQMPDAPREWRYDEQAETLYAQFPQGAKPQTCTVSAKRRRLAFDLSKRSFIEVRGFEVEAATLSLAHAEHCLVQGLYAHHISHTRGGRTAGGIGADGIELSGTGNTIRDCEIAYTVGSGIVLSGTRNAVVNCYIHDTDYFGCYGCPVKISGAEHLISHNTIHDTGRDGLQYGGRANVIQFNHIYRVGLLTHDLGITYRGGTDGDGTELHHNWFHDNLASASASGLYLDNYTHNFLIHHNVIWNIPGLALHLNRPSGYNLAFNNTIFGKVRHWGRWPGEEVDGMFGDGLANNLVTGEMKMLPEVRRSHNLVKLPRWTDAEGWQAAANVPAAAVDGGRVIPGITDGFVGKAPDVGAYEAGAQPWRAGHDFENPPRPEYRLTTTRFSNRVRNSCFEFFLRFYGGPDNGKHIAPWTRTGAGRAFLKVHPGFETSPHTRDSRYGGSLRLPGDNEDGVEQHVDGLTPGVTYSFGGFVKTSAAEAKMRVGVRSHAGAEAMAESASTRWVRLSVDFTPQRSEATVFITKLGAGEGFADDVGVAPAMVATPVVSAGEPQHLPDGVTAARLQGRGDFGDQPSDGWTCRWRLASGPAEAVIAEPPSLGSDVTFTRHGRYTLMLVLAKGDIAVTDVTLVIVPHPDASTTAVAPTNMLTLKANGEALPDGTLICGNGTRKVGGDVRAFFSFDLAALSRQPLSGAVLRVFLHDMPGDLDRYGGARIDALETPWADDSIGWDSPLVRGATLALDRAETPKNRWVEFDVSDLVRRWTKEGRKTADFTARGTEGYTMTGRQLVAADGSKGPQLVVRQEPVD